MVQTKKLVQKKHLLKADAFLIKDIQTLIILLIL